MKEMRLMQIIGDIDEKYIDEAAPGGQKQKAIRFAPWVRYVGIAACARSLSASEYSQLISRGAVFRA